MNQLSDILAQYFVDPNANRQRAEKVKRNISIYFFIGILFAEICCSLMSFLCIKSFKVWYFLIVCLCGFLIWSVIGRSKGLISKLHFLFWLQVCAHLLMFIFALSLRKHNFIICGSGTIIIIFLFIQACSFKSFYVSPLFIFLYLWFSCVDYKSMRKLSYSSGYVSAFPLLFLLLIFLYLGNQILQKLPKQNFVKIQFTFLLYPLSVLFVITLSSFIDLNYIDEFNYLTFINHIAFLYVTKRFCESSPFAMRKLYISTLNQLSLKKSRNQMYQNGDLKCSKCEKIENIKFCYQGCFHVLCSRCIMKCLKEKLKCSRCNLGPTILWMQRIQQNQSLFYIIKKSSDFHN